MNETCGCCLCSGAEGPQAGDKHTGAGSKWVESGDWCGTAGGGAVSSASEAGPALGQSPSVSSLIEERRAPRERVEERLGVEQGSVGRHGTVVAAMLLSAPAAPNTVTPGRVPFPPPPPHCVPSLPQQRGPSARGAGSPALVPLAASRVPEKQEGLNDFSERTTVTRNHTLTCPSTSVLTAVQGRHSPASPRGTLHLPQGYSLSALVLFCLSPRFFGVCSSF